MKRDDLDNLLYETGAQVLEELSFMPVSPEVDVVEDIRIPDVSVQVPFSGIASGKLRFAIDAAVMPVLTGDMLGEDETTQKQQLDAICEYANVICGNFLPLMLDASADFALGTPEAESFVSSADGQPAASARYRVDDGRIRVQLFLEDQAMGEERL